ncbi:mannosyl-oligosaccharide alpha-1-2-mannosidase [Apiospora rasikravindrae]|uniref:alpha-1,2-Mannosidase n=1 Tax=Apiospora rasikravindrae TaxID=990691 RepID=A0ABR1SM43_9PEZI
MARRVTRLILGAVALWVLATWYYAWSPPQTHTPNYGVIPDNTVDKGIRWNKPPPNHPVQSLTPLPTELPSRRIPTVQATPPKEDEDAKKIRMKRLNAVKESFLHSWNGYKKNAWLKDEVLPLTADYQNPFGGWAATLVDSLDSLWILGLKEEFEIAVRSCELIDFTTTETKEINVFETTIRYLGGFLAAYELSGKQHPSLLKKATEVGELLMGAFDTPNRMPVARWDWQAYLKGKNQKPSFNTLISEIGSLSMEMSKLSQLTGDMMYHDAAQRLSDEIEAGQSKTKLPGMWPVVVDPSVTPVRFAGDSFTLGGMSDSLYEYFPKQYLILGGALEQPRKMYEGFIDVAKKHLFRRALNPDDIPILFSGDANIRRNPSGDPLVITRPRAQHLTCFAGGMVALAAKIFERPADMETAKQLTDGCVWSYFATPSGIGPEIFTFIPCDPDPAKDDCKWSQQRWIDAGKQYWYGNLEPGEVLDKSITDTYKERKLPEGMVEVNDRRYILRPEAIESVFLMYRMTGDKKWADKAWKMFQAVEKHTRTRTAAAALNDVTLTSPPQVDSMESFWLAETLKYFYLVFSDFDVVSLDTWVLNTEAHPLRRADAMG